MRGRSLQLFTLVISGEVTTIVSKNCQSFASFDDYTVHNSCAYPACSPPGSVFAVDQWRCVHDEGFCKDDELFIPASVVMDEGLVCTCKDILDYPKIINSCRKNGVYTPMLTMDDCGEGSPVCNSGEGDTDHPFTACDLKCNSTRGHVNMIPEDTYQIKSYPKFDWTVASKSELYTIHVNEYEIMEDMLYIGGSVVPKKCDVGGTLLPLDKCGAGTSSATSPLIHGPFTPSDPSSINGTSNKMVMNGNRTSGFALLETGIIDRFPRQCAIMMIDKDTGVPEESVFILEGTRECYISAMDSRGGLDKNVIVAGGYLTSGGELYIKTSNCIEVQYQSGRIFGASTSCKNGLTNVEADLESDTAFVFLMEENGDIRWVTQPWLTLIKTSNRYNATVSGVSIDTFGNVYISGSRVEYEDNTEKKYAMVSKHFGSDGTLIWEKEFADARGTPHLVEDVSESGNIIYFTFSTVGTDDLGGSYCVLPYTGEFNACNVLAQLSAEDGSVSWARYAHGFSGDTNSGKVKLAHPNDGPYVYVTYTGTGSQSPSHLDLGTSYSGCRNEDGEVTTEYDLISPGQNIPLSSSLNPNICNEKNLGTYFDRRSQYAVPARDAHSNAFCKWNKDTEHCLVKYHKLTGLPIWGTVVPQCQDFQPLTDGIVMIGHKKGRAVFDTVQVSSPVRTVKNEDMHNVAFQSKIDLDGNGVYVQPITAHQSSAISIGLAHDPDIGNVYIGFHTESSTTYLGSGYPVGFVQHLELRDKCKFDCDPHVTIAKLGMNETPSCILQSNTPTIIKNGMCFIDEVCYLSGESAIRLGMPCSVCNPVKSQNSWTEHMVGESYCLIDGICHTDGDPLVTAIPGLGEISSECKICRPKENPYDWTLKHGYEGLSSDDCKLKTLAPSLPPSYYYYYYYPSEPTSPPSYYYYYSDEPTSPPSYYYYYYYTDDSSDGNDDSNGVYVSVVAYVLPILLPVIGVGLYLCCRRFRKKKNNDVQPEFFPVEGDLI